MAVLKKIGVWSLAKIYMIVCAVMGLIMGIFFVILSSMGLKGMEPLPGVSGAGLIIALPIFYALLGLGGGALFAWMYNIFSDMVGGVEVEIEDKKKK